MNIRRFPAEWEPQSAVLMAWPHEGTDWSHMLDEVRNCFSEIIRAIVPFQKLVLLVPDELVARQVKREFGLNLIPVIAPTNDTWARDFGPIFVQENNQPFCLDFKFNGWGLKFAADKDNLITKKLIEDGIFTTDVIYENQLNFVLEGGALESDGKGTLLTTSECLLSPNRNGQWSKQAIEDQLKKILGLTRVLWLNHGFLEGDDTDSHIDTLARFCNADTIAFVQCSDKDDLHFDALQKMEQELRGFSAKNGKPYNLIPLPMAEEVTVDGERLPATYANFLIINDAVLVPTYNSTLDKVALNQFKLAFPDREIIGINCLPLIKQHGSLHCVTMQLPEGILETSYLSEMS